MTVVIDQAPERSLEQRLGALQNANQVRSYRAELKRAWKLGAPVRSVRDVLALPNEREQTWKVLDLLVAVPKVGRVKANKALVRCRVAPSKTVGGLSPRQRGELLAALGGIPSAVRTPAFAGQAAAGVRDRTPTDTRATS